MSVFDQRLSGAIGGQTEPGEETEKKPRREKKEKPSRREEPKEPKKKKREEAPAKPAGEFTPDTSRWTQADEEEAEFEEKLLREQEMNAIEAKRGARIRAVTDAVLIAMCVYMVSLIYGVFNTDFKYGETGEIEPVVLSVEDLSERAQYSVVLNLYYRCRNEYQEILKLDWMLLQEAVDNKSVAPKYEVESGKCSVLVSQIDGADIDVKYFQVGQLMYEWASTAAGYCEHTARALTAYSAEAESMAVQDRENTSGLFYDLTQNLVILGQDLAGIDTSDIYNWDPEAYVRKEMTGVE